MTIRYACTGCSFATSDADRMLGHASATGHLSGKPAPHPPANCGPLTLPLPPGVRCPTCGDVPEPASSTELADRRQRAREAAFDESARAREQYAVVPQALEAAIEAATRVQITPEILAAFRDTIDTTTAKLRAAFRAAGFEVEE